jgi:hypothetical protein
MSVQGNVNIQPVVPPTALPAPQTPQTVCGTVAVSLVLMDPLDDTNYSFT